ncbi:unnamed protein product [Tilletia controversa]|nr:unnamed protein product [Tilletia controversa]CAD6933123.1 unnamed protein product [Tilletia controversa]CAD6967168.1 unnamed protein product [Tilletia controversa]
MAQETPQERPPSLLPNLVKRNLHGHVESTGINLMHAAVMSPTMTTSFPKPEPSLALCSMLQGFYSDQSSLSSINSRIDPHQLAFRSPEHLLQWRVTASSRAMMLSRLEDQIVRLPLTGFCAAWLPHVVDLFQSDSQPAAAYVLEVIAALLRDELERKYSHKLLLSLCHALGALSIVSREDGEIKKAIATASYAIKLLQPSLEKDSKRRIPIMANLKLEHAHALS